MLTTRRAGALVVVLGLLVGLRSGTATAGARSIRAEAVPTEPALLRALPRVGDFGRGWRIVATNADTDEAGSNFASFDACGISPDRPISEVGEVATSPKGLEVGTIIGRMPPGSAESFLTALPAALAGCADRFAVLARSGVRDRAVKFSLNDSASPPRSGYAAFFRRGDVLAAVVLFHQSGSPKLATLKKYSGLVDSRIRRIA